MQDLQLFFTYGHRRSCSVLQRNSTEDASVTERMSGLVNFEDGREETLDKVSQDGCEQGRQTVNIETDLRDLEVGIQRRDTLIIHYF